jgi:ABC-2 type transport system permease protein
MSAIFNLWKREMLRFLRQRSRWIGALLTPLVFWLLIGGGLGSSFQDPSTGSSSYLQFFFPGTLLLSVLFTAIFSTMSVIEDRHQGFLQGILVAPGARTAFLIAKLLAGATLGTIQGGILLFFAGIAGFELSFVGILGGLVLLFILAASLTLLGFYFAWKLDSVQGYHGIMNTLLMPLWILSGAVFPAENTPVLVRTLMMLNPLTYGLASLRHVLAGNVDDISWGPTLLVLGAFSLVFAFACHRELSKPVA